MSTNLQCQWIANILYLVVIPWSLRVFFTLKPGEKYFKNIPPKFGQSSIPMCCTVVTNYVIAESVLERTKPNNYQKYCSSMKKNFSDPETFMAFQQGDQNAYKIIFCELYEALVLFSFSYTMDLMPAEDIVIETFQKMSLTAAKKNNYEHFRAALYQTVKWRSNNYYKRELKRVVPIDEEVLSKTSEDSASNLMLSYDVVKTIREETDRLKGKQKIVAEYLFIKLYTTEEVAEFLGVKEKTVSNQKAILLNKFLEALRKKDLPLFILFLTWFVMNPKL
jgi:RNA polymerase sigma-70 factor (ECF subfamily)